MANGIYIYVIVYMAQHIATPTYVYASIAFVAQYLQLPTHPPRSDIDRYAKWLDYIPLTA